MRAIAEFQDIDRGRSVRGSVGRHEPAVLCDAFSRLSVVAAAQESDAALAGFRLALARN